METFIILALTISIIKNNIKSLFKKEEDFIKAQEDMLNIISLAGDNVEKNVIKILFFLISFSFVIYNAAFYIIVAVMVDHLLITLLSALLATLSLSGVLKIIELIKYKKIHKKVKNVFLSLIVSIYSICFLVYYASTMELSTILLIITGYAVCSLMIVVFKKYSLHT